MPRLYRYSIPIPFSLEPIVRYDSRSRAGEWKDSTPYDLLPPRVCRFRFVIASRYTYKGRWLTAGRSGTKTVSEPLPFPDAYIVYGWLMQEIGDLNLDSLPSLPVLPANNVGSFRDFCDKNWSKYSFGELLLSLRETFCQCSTLLAVQFWRKYNRFTLRSVNR